MATYYIDNTSATASDQNAGTSQDAPFASLSALSTIQFQPGDTIKIKAGTTYNTSADGDAALIISSSGTADAPITITSYGIGAKPVVNNTSSVEYSDAIGLRGAHYIVIDGLSFQSATQTAVNVEASSSHITVENNDISNVGEGVILTGTDNLVTGNSIHDLHMVKNTPTDTTNARTRAATDNDDYGATGIEIMGSNNEASFNRIINAKAASYDYGVDGGGFDLYGSMNNVSIHDNYVEGSDGFLEAGGPKGSAISDVKISNNVGYNNGNFVDIHNGGAAFAASFSGIDISQNTIVNTDNSSDEYSTIYLDSATTSNLIDVHGNIFQLNAGDSVFKQEGSYHSDNLFNLQSNSTYLYNDQSMTLGSNEQYGDPGLDQTAQGDFTPSASGFPQTVGVVVNAQLQEAISGVSGLFIAVVAQQLANVAVRSARRAEDTSGAGDNTGASSITLSGVVIGGSGATVRVSDHGTMLGTATVDDDGTWSYTTTLDAGTHDLSTTATDASGATASSAASTIRISSERNVMVASSGTITGSAGDDVLIADQTQATADAGATIILDGNGGRNALYGGGAFNTFMAGNGSGFNEIHGGQSKMADVADYSNNTVDFSNTPDGQSAYVDLLKGHNGYLYANANHSGTLTLQDSIVNVPTVIGSSGGDLIRADDAGDTITGGGGSDILYAGGGADTFVYKSYADSNVTDGYDTVSGFRTGQDKLDLSAFDLDAAHLAIFSGPHSTSLYLEQTAGHFSASTDLAISFAGAHAIGASDVFF